MMGQIAQTLARRPQGTLPSNTEENSRGQVKSIHVNELEQHTMEEEEEQNGGQEQPTESEASDEEYKSDGDEEINESDSSHEVEEEEKSNGSEEETIGLSEEDINESDEGEEDEIFECLHEKDREIHEEKAETTSEGDDEGSEVLHDEASNKPPTNGGEGKGNTLHDEHEEEEEDDGPHTSFWTMETLPTKQGDLGSFSISCNFYNLFKCNGFIDLGASVNMMPFYMNNLI